MSISIEMPLSQNSWIEPAIQSLERDRNKLSFHSIKPQRLKPSKPTLIDGGWKLKPRWSGSPEDQILWSLEASWLRHEGYLKMI